MRHQAGGHFLRLPDHVLGVIAAPTFVRCGPAFAVLASKTIEVLKAVSNTTGTIMMHPSSGVRAWEAAPTCPRRPGGVRFRAPCWHVPELLPLGARSGVEMGLLSPVCSTVLTASKSLSKFSAVHLGTTAQ